jgi:hypothetical protein
MTKATAFWNLFEATLAANVAASPDHYALTPQSPEAYAKQVRARFEAAGVAKCDHKSPTFQQVARILCIKGTRKALIEASTEK